MSVVPEAQCPPRFLPRLPGVRGSRSGQQRPSLPPELPRSHALPCLPRKNVGNYFFRPTSKVEAEGGGRGAQSAQEAALGETTLRGEYRGQRGGEGEDISLRTVSPIRHLSA